MKIDESIVDLLIFLCVLPLLWRILYVMSFGYKSISRSDSYFFKLFEVHESGFHFMGSAKPRLQTNFNEMFFEFQPSTALHEL